MSIKTPPYAEIGLVIYPTALMSAVYGLTDLFMIANLVAAKHPPSQRPTLRVTHWKSDEVNTSDIQNIFDTHGDAPKGTPTFLLLPPCISDPIDKDTARPYANWIKAKHDAGAVIGSVCAGAFLLAETGLLKSRAATTHWSYIEAFAARFPDIPLDGDKLLIDDGDILTAGGMMAWTDLGLRIVHRVLGPTIMLEVARFMLVDPPGREQRYYSSFAPNLLHGDKPILKVQHWLQINGARDVDVAMMCAEAGMEERTFLRRFQKATGLKPTEYCQQLRVGKAREMLEFTQQNIEQIAWSVGYEDAGAFRKVFHKLVGLSPGQYRERFGLQKLQQRT